VKNSISFMSRPRRAVSEWVLHCEVNQRHMRRIQPTREAALKDACSQLLQGHAVNRIVGPNKTITAERVKDWCAKHRLPLWLCLRADISRLTNTPSRTFWHLRNRRVCRMFVLHVGRCSPAPTRWSN